MKYVVEGKEFNIKYLEEIASWKVGKETDDKFYSESLDRTRGGQFILSSTCWEKDFKSSTSEVKFITPKEVWPLLAAKRVDPNCLSRFHNKRLRVMKGDKHVGFLELFDLL